MKLETIGKMLASGFGDKVLIGVLMGFLENVSPMRCYEYIKDDIQVFHWASDSHWQKLRRMAKSANIGDVTRDDVVKELKKSRPDILSVIINTPGGYEWLNIQITEMKKKLGIE